MPDLPYRPRTLPQVVAEAAAEHADRPAVTDGEVRLTYAELDAARLRAARAFVAAGRARRIRPPRTPLRSPLPPPRRLPARRGAAVS